MTRKCLDSYYHASFLHILTSIHISYIGVFEQFGIAAKEYHSPSLSPFGCTRLSLARSMIRYAQPEQRLGLERIWIEMNVY